MTAISITVAAEHLDAAMAAVSKEETRYYLRGVFIDARGFIAATNGHIAFAARCAAAKAFADTFAPGCGTGGNAGVLVPEAALLQALKGKGDECTIERDAGGLYWLQRGAVRVHFVPVDGAFPDWTRVVPEAPETETAAHFDPKYVAAMGKMAVALRGGKKGEAACYHIHQAGERPALVTFPRKVAKITDPTGPRDDCCAVLMPMRAHNAAGFVRAAFLAA